METVVFCSSELRREKVRAAGVLNGIDFLEVDHPAQTTLTVTFLRNLPALTENNFRVEGGVRVGGIKVIPGGVTIANNVATIKVDRRGDFSDYTLRVVSGPGSDDPPAGFDSRLSVVEFNFKVLCPSDFDCKPDRDCPEEPGDEADIDYLAKDYATFRRLMLDRMTVTMPAWKERNAADLTIALVEALAYVGDHLSYFQDSVATEAYLGTARRRTSIRRHARLLDYAMHEGANARTFVCLELDSGSPADGQLLAKGTPLLDNSLGEGARVLPTAINLAVAMPVVFETVHDLTLAAVKSQIKFHTWSDLDCCLPKGATSAWIVRPAGLTLRPGDFFAFYEVPVWGEDRLVREANTTHRHVVRLRTVTPGRDDFEAVDLYNISWSPEDALPFAACLSTEVDGVPYTDVSIGCANVVLADHGQTLPASPPVPDRPSTGERYRPTLVPTGLTFAVPYDPAASATALLRTDPHAAVAALTLTTANYHWTVVGDLLRAGPFDPFVVVESETDGVVNLRFGDDTNGMAPNPDEVFAAAPRIGNGTAGNVGHDVLVRVVYGFDGITNVFNPLPATGGVEPEPIEEVRQFAPEAYKVQERAVTETDYARMAERHPEVQAARAQFRWTGSWHTVFLAVDRLGGGSVLNDPEFKASLLAHMDRYRMAGVDIELREPIYVPLEIVVRICVANGYFQSDVHRRLLKTFRDFFDPDRFTFGDDVYLSQILSAAMGVAGVDHAVVETFKRWAQTENEELAKGRISIAANEIARLLNDPSLPEDGRINFILEGGV